MNKDYVIEKLTTLRDKGSVVLDMKEAAWPGSSFNKGGEFAYTSSFFSLRYTNPLRLGTVIETYPDPTAVRWVAKIGDSTSTSSPTGAWGDGVVYDQGNSDTAFWSLPQRTVSTILPIRSFIWEDIPNAYMSILGDVLYELSQREAESACANNDANTVGTAVTATGSTAVTGFGNGYQWTLSIPSTTGITVGSYVQISGATPATLNGYFKVLSFVANTSVTIFYPSNPGNYSSGTVSVTPSGTAGLGGQQGLRGLDSYASSPVTFSAGTAINQNPGFIWGASGDSVGADNFGRHSIVTIQQGGASPSNTVVYNDLLNVSTSLPGQYWGLETTCWQVSPQKINELRVLKDTNNLPVLLDVGIPREGGAGVSFMGWPVIVNPYLSAKYPMYLMNSMMALSFVDYGEVELQLVEQYLPGTIAVYARKRVAFSIKDPAAIVRLQVGS